MNKTTRGAASSDVMADIDNQSSLEQVPGAGTASGKNDMAAGMDIDEMHGGVNQIVEVPAGAAPGTTMTMYSCSAPTPKDMGIN